jgi:hypothetical protein
MRGTSLVPLPPYAAKTPKPTQIGAYQFVCADARGGGDRRAHRDPAAQSELDRVFGDAQHAQPLSTPVSDVIATGRSRLFVID